jgi:hypothetical protein
MDPSTIAFVKGIVSFVVLSSTGLTAYWLRLRHRASDDDRQLRDDMDRLSGELQEIRRALEVELPDSQERLDFLERRLAQLPSPSRPERPESTPV